MFMAFSLIFIFFALVKTFNFYLRLDLNQRTQQFKKGLMIKSKVVLQ